jgi:hypothetical protein
VRNNMVTAAWQGLTRRSLYALPVLAVNSLLTDGTAVALNVAFGLPTASLLHWLLLAPWFCAVTWALHHRILPDALAEWVERRQGALGPRLQRLLRWGTGPAVLTLGALFPLSGLLGMRLLGVPAPRRYALAVGIATGYAVVTTGLFYGGGWLLLQQVVALFRP